MSRYMVAWNPSEDGRAAEVHVGLHPDRTGWSTRFACTSGHCFAHFQDYPPQERAERLLGLSLQLVVDGVPPADVLREFARIPEWRGMSIRLPGGDFARAVLPRNPAVWSPHNPA